MTVLVRVEPYEGMAAGDEVLLRWDSGVVRTSWTQSRVVAEQAVGKDLEFSVPASGGGTVRVSYVVEGPTGSRRLSAPLALALSAGSHPGG
ncbi:hypothetical protein [Streptomyces sp. YS-3]|uniref:hypothetical protein n=1 Tax=Streptomyces sp. YS-3 TaxID=3381352 RepID=UPI003862C029